MEWRNDPLTREMSFTTDIVARETHIPWLKAQLEIPTHHTYIASAYGEPVGVIRAYEWERDIELHVTVAPEYRGRGASTQMILWMVKHLSSVGNLFIARIKEQNLRSTRAFIAAGFKEIGRRDDTIIMERPPHIDSTEGGATWTR